MILLAIIMFSIAGFFKAAADTLESKFEASIFKNWNPKYWSKGVSWVNKYKNGNKEEGEKFPLSTTALSFLTDGWHLANFFRNISILMGIVFFMQTKVDTNLIWGALLAIGVFLIPFTFSTEMYLRMMVTKMFTLRSTQKLKFWQWLISGGKKHLVWISITSLILIFTIIYAILQEYNWLPPLIIMGVIALLGTIFIIRDYRDYKKGIYR